MSLIQHSATPLILQDLPAELLRDVASYLKCSELNNFLRASKDLHSKLNFTLYLKGAREKDLRCLIWACAHARPEVIQHVVDLFPPGNSTNIRPMSHVFNAWTPRYHGMTILMLAIKMGYQQMTQRLISMGAKVNKTEDFFAMRRWYRWRPIHWAVMNDHPQVWNARKYPTLPMKKSTILRLLLGAGADPNAPVLPSIPWTGPQLTTTPLMYAVQNNADPVIIALLLDYGADPVAACMSDLDDECNAPTLQTPLSALLRMYDFVDGYDLAEDWRDTDRGQKHLESALLLARASVGRWTKEFPLNNIFTMCLMHPHTSPYWISLIEELLKQGADPNSMTVYNDEDVNLWDRDNERAPSRPCLQRFLEDHWWFRPIFYFNPLYANNMEKEEEYEKATNVTCDIVELLLKYGGRLEKSTIARVRQARGFEKLSNWLVRKVNALSVPVRQKSTQCGNPRGGPKANNTPYHGRKSHNKSQNKEPNVRGNHTTNNWHRGQGQGRTFGNNKRGPQQSTVNRLQRQYGNGNTRAIFEKASRPNVQASQGDAQTSKQDNEEVENDSRWAAPQWDRGKGPGYW